MDYIGKDGLHPVALEAYRHHAAAVANGADSHRPSRVFVSSPREAREGDKPAASNHSQ